MKTLWHALLFVPFCVLAADPMMLNLNFDGHPDQMIVVGRDLRQYIR